MKVKSSATLKLNSLVPQKSAVRVLFILLCLQVTPSLTDNLFLSFFLSFSLEMCLHSKIKLTTCKVGRDKAIKWQVRGVTLFFYKRIAVTAAAVGKIDF